MNAAMELFVLPEEEALKKRLNRLMMQSVLGGSADSACQLAIRSTRRTGLEVEESNDHSFWRIWLAREL